MKTLRNHQRLLLCFAKVGHVSFASESSIASINETKKQIKKRKF